MDFLKIDNWVLYFSIGDMNRLKEKIRFYLIPSLLFVGFLHQSNAVDFNNTQVQKEIFDKALSWGNLQVRNGILYAPKCGAIPQWFYQKTI